MPSDYQSTTVFRDAAHQLASVGWHVYPTVIGRRKPAIRDWPNAATIKPEQIKAWWGRWPDANVGVSTKKSRLIGIDLDGERGADSAHDWMEEYGPLPACPSVTTRRGCHLYFRAPEGVMIRSSQSKIAPGVDVLAVGATMPPSVRDGVQAYHWQPGLAPWEIETPELPDWLLDLLTAGNREPEDLPPSAPSKPVLHDEWGPKPSYAQKALEAAADAIARAGEGEQQTMLMRQSFGIGQLLGAGLMPLAYAEAVLIRAGMEMHNFDRHRRWTRQEVAACVRRGLEQGQRRPREPRERR
ncbi:bifunctional DNA primase/polymerase [Marinivivus vitaminiproducens]|uniref:bifunctional DNA primase/polymerase n=1 Tax=Marinivivus vitaminiproducens TaxID=3035935 RepID=UPI0027A2620C|nr:bifunctional DNA primase/polymerase [Geminicoccaceae bacterium SCSIO 64248]